MGHEAKNIESVIQTHHQHPTSRPGRCIKLRLRGRAIQIATAVNPDHDRQGFGVFGCPDIEVQTVFAHEGVERVHIA